MLTLLLVLSILLVVLWSYTRIISTCLASPKQKTVLYLVFFLLIIYIFSSENILSFNLETHSKLKLKGKDIFTLKFPWLYNVFNPSIHLQDGRFSIVLRCSTLTQKNLYNHLYGEEKYTSFLMFSELNRNGQRKLVYPYENFLQGNWEDPRMVRFGDYYYVSATEFNGFGNIFPVLLKYSLNYDFIEKLEYNRKDYFGTNGSVPSIQKNWCPFLYRNQLYLHTDSFPVWKVFKCQIENSSVRLKLITEKRIPILSLEEQKQLYLRCSTSWKKYDKKTYICGLHTKTKGRIPTIRSILVLIDKKTLLPIKRTDIFSFLGKRIEFLSGLETDLDNVYLSYGVNDSEARIRKIEKKLLIFHDLRSVHDLR